MQSLTQRHRDAGRLVPPPTNAELTPSEANLADVISKIARRIASDNLSPEARRQQ